MLTDADKAWQQWLEANPNKTICTHWREAFGEGYAAATAERDRLKEQLSQANARIAALEGQYNLDFWFDTGDKTVKLTKENYEQLVARASQVSAMTEALGEEWELFDANGSSVQCRECKVVYNMHHISTHSIYCRRGRFFAALAAQELRTRNRSPSPVYVIGYIPSRVWRSGNATTP